MRSSFVGLRGGAKFVEFPRCDEIRPRSARVIRQPESVGADDEVERDHGSSDRSTRIAQMVVVVVVVVIIVVVSPVACDRFLRSNRSHRLPVAETSRGETSGRERPG